MERHPPARLAECQKKPGHHRGCGSHLLFAAGDLPGYSGAGGYLLFADPETISSHLDSAAGLLPGGAIEVIRDQLTRTTSHGAGTLGFTFLGGLAVSLWSANAGIKSIFGALNLVYNEQEKRGFFMLNLVSWLRPQRSRLRSGRSYLLSLCRSCLTLSASLEPRI
jgi:Virulence factor BrkB